MAEDIQLKKNVLLSLYISESGEVFKNEVVVRDKSMLADAATQEKLTSDYAELLRRISQYENH